MRGDFISGTSAADTLVGGDGDDSLQGGTGADVLTGGAGRDAFFMDFAPDRANVTKRITDFEPGETLYLQFGVQLSQVPVAPVSFIGTDAFSGTRGEVRYGPQDGGTRIEIDMGGGLTSFIVLEGVTAPLRTYGLSLSTLQIDMAYGAPSQGDDGVGGGAGDDRIDGLAGDDDLHGGAGDDTLDGGEGADTITGGLGDDLVRGGAGDDSLVLSGGRDTISGGAGTDEIDLTADGQALVTLTDERFFNAASGVEAALSGIERAFLTNRVTGAFGDVLDASAFTGDVLFFAGAGDDRLIGGSGDDALEGDTGDDTLTGGAGDDEFDFDYLEEMSLAGDVITDFEFGDRLDFEIIELALQFDPFEGLDLTFIADADFSGAAGEYGYRFDGDRTLVQIDATGDALADHTVVLEGGLFRLEASLTASGGRENVLTLPGDASVDDVGDDLIYGRNGADTLEGLGGADELHGLGGDDLLIGGDGADRLYGGLGDDVIYGDGA